MKAKQVSIWKSLLSKKMLITMLMGFSSGLPLLLTGKTLQLWMADVGVDLKTIGFFAMAGIPASFKFLWSPLMDRFSIQGFGRRRTWLVISQISLTVALLIVASTDPKNNLYQMAVMAVLVAFFSASQDVAVDAYRRESLDDSELGLGSTFYVYGYRIAMYISGGVAILLAAKMSWSSVYYIMAAMMAVGLVTTFWAPEPVVDQPMPKSMREAVVEPFKEFLSRHGAILILLFIILYKIGDNMAGGMLNPYYIKMGYSKEEIAYVAKTLGLVSTLSGSFLGGALILRLGLYNSLWLFGLLQATSTAMFAVLSVIEKSTVVFASVVVAEDLTGGMGTAAFVAFMGSMTNKKFTATQYALLSSFMGVPRTIFSSYSGMLAELLGWQYFFVSCGLMAIPGLIMIYFMKRLNQNTTIS